MLIQSSRPVLDSSTASAHLDSNEPKHSVLGTATLIGHVELSRCMMRNIVPLDPKSDNSCIAGGCAVHTVQHMDAS